MRVIDRRIDMRVDVHAHCYPEQYVEELKRLGAGDQGGIGIRIPKWSGSEKRIHEMDNLGVDIQVLGLSAPNVYLQDPELSKALAQMTNDFISDVCKENPDRFLGLASVPLNNMKYAVDELERAVNDLQMDGVLLGTNVNQRSLSEDQFLPFFEEIDKKGIPVVLHPMKAIGEELLLDEDIKLRIPSSVGFVFETTRTIAQMTFKGTFEKYKNLTFILPHSGGAIPFLYPRWEIAYLFLPDTHPLRKVPNPPRHYLKRHYYDTALSYYPSSLKCTVDLASVDHIVFGTDSPYTDGPVSKETIENIETYGFSNEEKEKIFFRNAAKLFPKLKEKVSSAMK
jgi:predicted TIM-barrel fold metal-dependent hydrolase